MYSVFLSSVLNLKVTNFTVAFELVIIKLKGLKRSFNRCVESGLDPNL